VSECSVSEEWRVIPGFERYEISNFGNARRVADGTELTGQVIRGGYRSYNLTNENGPRAMRAHRLVMFAFVGPASGDLVRHLDGDATNNYVGNLAYGTYSENTRDALRHGTLHNPMTARTHCKYGHEFTPENTLRFHSQPKSRRCRKCKSRMASQTYRRSLERISGTEGTD
jgi:hypothetical protein